MKNNHFKGLPILGDLKNFNTRYLDRIIDTINYACDEHNRVYSVRFDLHIPNSNHETDCLSRDEIISFTRNRDKLMSRFMESLKSKIKSQETRYKRLGKRVYPTSVKSIWCRERDTSINDHYHVALFFNKDRYFGLGNYRSRDSLAGMISEAWASALGIEFEWANGLVHFPDNNKYYLECSKDRFNQQYQDLFRRLSYLAKKETKNYGEGYRNFGCSQR